MSIDKNGGVLTAKTDWLPSEFQPFFEPLKEWLDLPCLPIRTLPYVNALEAKDPFEIRLAAPGLKKADFRVHVQGDILHVEAESSGQKDEKQEDHSRREYNFTSFRRTFKLPDSAGADRIRATYVDGELRLELPKEEDARKVPAKTIAIQ